MRLSPVGNRLNACSVRKFCSGRGSSIAKAANAVNDCQQGHRSACQKTRAQADNEGLVVLIHAVDDPDDLKNAKAAKGDERHAFIALFAPDGQGLGNKQGRVANQGKAEDKCNDFSHGNRPETGEVFSSIFSFPGQMTDLVNRVAAIGAANASETVVRRVCLCQE